MFGKKVNSKFRTRLLEEQASNDIARAIKNKKKLHEDTLTYCKEQCILFEIGGIVR